MHVVFLPGPVAAGKHTIGAHLSSLTGLPLFHNHLAVDPAVTLFPFGTEPFKKLRAAIWLTAFAEAAESGQSFIFTFSPESSVEPGLIEQMIQSVVARGGKIAFVELQCSREETLRRLGGKDRARFRKLLDVDVFLQAEERGVFAFPPLPKPLLTINTEQLAPEQAARAISQALSFAFPDSEA